MARRLRLAQCQRMLDLATGAGHWGLRLLPHLHPDARMTGLDMHEHFATYVHEQAAAKQVRERVEFKVSRLESLPFDDDSFDLVTCQTVMIHLAAPELAPRVMPRVTRPGGLVLCPEPDNRAGDMALVNGHPRPSDADLIDIFTFLPRRDGGKRTKTKCNVVSPPCAAGSTPSKPTWPRAPTTRPRLRDVPVRGPSRIGAGHEALRAATRPEGVHASTCCGTAFSPA